MEIEDFDLEQKRKCPICKRTYTGYPAISRKDNKTAICPRCGVQEALDAFDKEQLRDSMNEFVKQALKTEEGTSYKEVMEDCSGRALCLVIGKVDNEFRIKLAFNVDDLQCDYDVDWEMPYAENGDVYDTDTTIESAKDFDWDYWFGEAKTIEALVRQGVIKVGKCIKN